MSVTAPDAQDLQRYRWYREFERQHRGLSVEKISIISPRTFKALEALSDTMRVPQGANTLREDKKMYVRSILTAFRRCKFCLPFFPQVGDTYAIHFEGLDGRRTPTGNFGWSMRASTEFNHPLFCVCVFGAIAIQYIIALELRMAYCDLQDANLDLQVSGAQVIVLLNS